MASPKAPPCIHVEQYSPTYQIQPAPDFHAASALAKAHPEQMGPAEVASVDTNQDYPFPMGSTDW